jgi:hypothetical protein
LLAQAARTIKSRYRINMALNSIGQIGSIRKDLHKVT